MLDTNVPVSPGQAAYLNRQALAETEGRTVAPFKVVVAQQMEPEEIEPVCRLLASTVGSIEAYRTRFARDGDGSWICDVRPPFVHVPERIDVATAEEARSRAGGLLTAGFSRSVSNDGPRSVTRCVVAPDLAFLVTEVDHLVSDAAALVHAAAFTARASQQPGASDVTYGEYHRWLDAWVRSERAQRQIAWWHRVLGDGPTYTPIHLIGRPRGQVGMSPLGGRHRHLLDPRVADLGRQAWAAGRSPFQAAAACVATVLSRWTGQEEVRLSAAIPNRRSPESQGAIAWTAGSAPLAITARGTLAEVEASARKASTLAHLRGDVPIWEVVRQREPEVFLRGRTEPTCQVAVQHRFEWSAGELVELVPPPCLNGLRVAFGHESGHIDIHYDATWLDLGDAAALADDVAEVLARLLRDGSSSIDCLELSGAPSLGEPETA